MDQLTQDGATAESTTASPSSLDALSFSGRRAVVTGAGRGIGRAAAEKLAARGAEVILIARTSNEIEELASVISGNGGRATALPVDITDDDALERAFTELGHADILVNSAGTNRPKPILDITADDLDALLDLNVRSVFRVTQLFVRQALAHSAPSVIVNVSSQMGHIGSPNRTLYCATKHAIEGLTKALALELAPAGIRVVSVAPTFIETPLTRPFLDDPRTRELLIDRIPLGRIGTVDEVAEVIAFVAAPAAALITGSSVLTDGGWVAQ
ncbi:SDR family NAD(P)-dependent oxidoreductase [Nocardia pseudovaccinii]|uniref:SDR family NAD(P)-dependent oxidoreductase n=1 Tax=Nocardia pseudovaccinii TaxID=189540 RepID=UPI000A037B2D|nr:SDR family oxidoreductase [Nocardia pseudovaccinii]